jgi:hypothetical protein
MKFTYASGARPLQGYTIRRGLGRGGFGEVYLGVSDAGKEVALKLVQQHLDVELRGVGQCLNLKHPNLVVVHDILKAEDDETWIVMEYMAGESLEQLLARHRQGIPEPQALSWLHGICSGVRYLHEHGIVHRDLKPGNLFIEHGAVKIGDYGLSKFISASRRSGQTVSIGSVHYMAPEISHGRYGKEVDQYALGIILCEMLTGKVPFDGESHGEILMKHLTVDPDLVGLTEPYRSVVARLLDKDPLKRFPDVQDLLAELPCLDPTLASAFPGSGNANAHWGQQGRTETATHGAEPGSHRGVREPAKPQRAKRTGFSKGPLIRQLAENGMEVSDIRRVIRALRRYPGQQLPALVSAVQCMAAHNLEAKEIERLVRVLARRQEGDVPSLIALFQSLAEHDYDARDIERVLLVLGEHPERGLAGKVAAAQDMAEHGRDAKDIQRVLRGLEAYPKQDLRGLVTAVQLMVEHDLDGRDIERILGAFGNCSKHELAAKLETLQLMVEHGVDGKDIERLLRALSECPGEELAGVTSVVKSMVANGVDAGNIERLLCALRELPEHELADVVGAVQSMVEEGIEAEDIEKSVRAGRAYAE